MNRLRHIYPLMAALLTALLVSACYEDSYVGAEGEVEETTYLTFDITLPVINSSRTPSTPEDGYDPGMDEWENYIDIENDMHFYVFTGDDVTPTNKPQFVTMLNPTSTIILQDESDNRGSKYKRYKVRSIVKKKLELPFRLVALANCGAGNYPNMDANGDLKLGSNTIQTLEGLAENLTYHMPAPIPHLAGSTLIPMYGVTKITKQAVMGGDNKDRIDMLRAWAKVDIMVTAEETHDLKAGEVKLHNYNTYGLICPTAVYDRGEYVHGDWNTDYVGHVSLPDYPHTPGTVTGEVALQQHGTVHYDNDYPDRKVFTVYIPEYRNLTPGTTNLRSNHSYLTLKFDDPDDERTFTVDFKKYPDGAYFDIERNNYYKYTVRRTGFEIDLFVDVVPYIGVELDPLFGFDDFLPPQKD